LDVRRATRRTVASAVAAVAAGGCVDGFRGANVQIDLSPATPVQARIGAPRTAAELPAGSHFTLYAIQQDPMQDRLFEVMRFEVHRIVDETSPCFIDAGEHVPHPGLHVTFFEQKIKEDTGIADLANPPATATRAQKELAATAAQRALNLSKLGGDGGLRAVTSVSESTYSLDPGVASSCNEPDKIPPPMCTDEASNKRRLALCQAAWKQDPGLWEGTDRVLTAPLGGVTHGMVVGRNPINLAPVGGAQFFVDEALDHIDAYAIYTQTDGEDTPGTQLLFGRPTMPTRGVRYVHLVSPSDPALTAEMAVFADLGQDDVHF
jgi:hypothetical protein